MCDLPPEYKWKTEQLTLAGFWELSPAHMGSVYTTMSLLAMTRQQPETIQDYITAATDLS